MTSQKEHIVIAKDITKSFSIPMGGSAGIKQRVFNIAKGRKGRRNFTPLRDISFEVNKGDFFGIVGKNGSGKSTLLKILAGIYTPTKGSVHIGGSLVPFIELGVGFNPELTGRENVYLNGALLGFSHKEVDGMYAKIVEFAELDDFMEERLKNYSSGMQVRLAFSIAIQAKGDILLLDEVLAVGDAAFQQKCFDYFERLKREKRTIIIVTHDMGAVKRFCNRAMLISNGNIEHIGTPSEVADLYTEANIERAAETAEKDEAGDVAETMTLKAKLSKKRYKNDDDLIVDIAYSVPEDNAEYFVNLSLMHAGAVFADVNTKYSKDATTSETIKKIRFQQSLSGFNSGKYDVCLTLHRKADDRLIKQDPRAASFLVEGYDPSLDGPMKLSGKWVGVNK